jgi:hypothetical protein
VLPGAVLSNQAVDQVAADLGYEVNGPSVEYLRNRWPGLSVDGDKVSELKS